MEKLIVKLINGRRIANFSSPHAFNFEGEVLDGYDPDSDRVQKLLLKATEKEHKGIMGSTDIELKYEVTSELINQLYEDVNREDVDIVIIPYPVLQAIKERQHPTQMTIWTAVREKVRTVRMKDRGHKILYKDRFCI